MSKSLYVVLFRTLGVSFFLFISAFWVNISTARALTVENRGIYSSFVFFVLLTSQLNLLGLPKSLNLRFAEIDDDLKSAFSVIISIVTFSSAISSIFIAFFSPFSSEIYLKLLFVVTAIAASIYSLILAFTQRFPNLLVFNFLRVSYSSFLLIFVCLVPLFFNVSLVGYFIFSTLLAYFLSIMFLVYRYYLPSSNFSYFFSSWQESWLKGLGLISNKSFAFLSLSFFRSEIIGVIINNYDKIVILLLGSLDGFALYSVSYVATRSFQVFASSLASIVYARSQAKTVRIVRRNVLLMILFSGCVMLPIALIVSIVSNQLVVLLFGRDYLPAAPLISILSFEAAFNGLSFIASQFFIVLSLPKILFYRQLFSLIPLISSIFFIAYFEPTILMAFAMMVAAIIRLLCAFFYMVFRCDPPNRTLQSA